MATVASFVPPQAGSLAWFGKFFREELAPYPGRGALVARVVIAATIVMLIDMTFQIPYGAFAAIYALTISREHPEATVADAKITIVSFVCAAAYILVGAVCFAGDPVLRLVWVIATLFLVFYALGAVNYRAAARFGYMVVIVIPVWDLEIRAEQKVVQTLWAIASLSLANIITAIIEILYVRLYPLDNVTTGLVERLRHTASLLRSWSHGDEDPSSARQVARLAILGTSRMRRELLRSAHSSESADKMGAVLALVGRLVDLAANLSSLSEHLQSSDRPQFAQLADRIETLSDGLDGKRPLSELVSPAVSDSTQSPPMLLEMERTVSNITEILSGSDFLGGYHPPPVRQEPSRPFFAPDAFSNPEHVRFAIRGGLAASLCYLTYNLIAWPGISTAVTTCLVTALSTVGSSRQKQVLRFGGVLLGGVIFGFGAQLFILPAIDSITGFLILFVAVTTFCAWISASGPRLSYFGVQTALGFYLINLQEFKFQTSLAIARDRVAGVLLALLAMWTVFDQLWGASASTEMNRAFAANLRLLAKLMRAPVSNQKAAAIEETYSLRETIASNFEGIRLLGDGVMLEFGRNRERDLALRAQLLHWQLQLRVIFLARVALLKYRLRLPGFELPEPVHQAQMAFDTRLAEQIEKIADRIGGSATRPEDGWDRALLDLQNTLQESASSSSAAEFPGLRSFLPLCARIESLLLALDREIASA